MQGHSSRVVKLPAFAAILLLDTSLAMAIIWLALIAAIANALHFHMSLGGNGLQKRDALFVGPNAFATNNPRRAVLWHIQDGQLCDGVDLISTNTLAPYIVFAALSAEQPISRTWSLDNSATGSIINGVAWANETFSQGRASFCLGSDGRVYIVLRSNPPVCQPVVASPVSPPGPFFPSASSMSVSSSSLSSLSISPSAAIPFSSSVISSAGISSSFLVSSSSFAPISSVSTSSSSSSASTPTTSSSSVYVSTTFSTSSSTVVASTSISSSSLSDSAIYFSSSSQSGSLSSSTTISSAISSSSSAMPTGYSIGSDRYGFSPSSTYNVPRGYLQTGSGFTFDQCNGLCSTLRQNGSLICLGVNYNPSNTSCQMLPELNGNMTSTSNAPGSSSFLVYQNATTRSPMCPADCGKTFYDQQGVAFSVRCSQDYSTNQTYLFENARSPGQCANDCDFLLSSPPKCAVAVLTNNANCYIRITADYTQGLAKAVAMVAL